MPYIAYGPEKNIGEAKLKLIAWADAVATDYAARDLGLTLRQLYYQGVSANLFPNSERSYKNLGVAVTDGRHAGLIDWDHLTDRARQAGGIAWSGRPFPDAVESFRTTNRSHTHDLWRGQSYRPEIWVEKQALEQVAQIAADKFRLPYIACKGYMSASEMWEAGYNRIGEYVDRGERPVIIHLGDHDPSGMDMTRDIEERLATYSNGFVMVERIALNMDQIEQYAPPPNPAKITDSRAKGYIAEYGRRSWELDSLRPENLIDLITATVDSYLDHEVYEERQAEELEARRRVIDLADYLAPSAEEWLSEHPLSFEEE